MVFVGACIFAETDDLRRSGLARDVESGHANACARAAFIHHRPHRFDDHFVLIFGNRNDLWLRTVEGSGRTGGPVVCRVRFANRGDLAYLFQEMRDIHLAAHRNRGMSAQRGHRRQHILALTESTIDCVNIFPFRVFRKEFRFQFARRRDAHDLVREINPRPLVEIEHLHHLLHAFELHLEAETIEVGIAGDTNGRVDVGRAVIAAHAARELVADGNPAAADKV